MVGENGEGFLRVTDSVRAHPFPSIFIDLGFLGFLLSLPPLPSLTFSFLPLFPGQAAPKQDQQDRTRNNRTEPGQTGSIEPNQDQQDRTRTNRTEPGPTERTRISRTEPGLSAASEGGLGRSGTPLGASWGGSWRVLKGHRFGASWGRLGSSRGVLKASWVRLEAVLV